MASEIETSFQILKITLLMCFFILLTFLLINLVILSTFYFPRIDSFGSFWSVSNRTFVRRPFISKPYIRYAHQLSTLYLLEMIIIWPIFIAAVTLDTPRGRTAWNYVFLILVFLHHLCVLIFNELWKVPRKRMENQADSRRSSLGGVLQKFVKFKQGERKKRPAGIRGTIRRDEPEGRGNGHQIRNPQPDGGHSLPDSGKYVEDRGHSLDHSRKSVEDRGHSLPDGRHSPPEKERLTTTASRTFSRTSDDRPDGGHVTLHRTPRRLSEGQRRRRKRSEARSTRSNKLQAFQMKEIKKKVADDEQVVVKDLQFDGKTDLEREIGQLLTQDPDKKVVLNTHTMQLNSYVYKHPDDISLDVNNRYSSTNRSNVPSIEYDNSKVEDGLYRRHFYQNQLWNSERQENQPDTIREQSLNEVDSGLRKIRNNAGIKISDPDLYRESSFNTGYTTRQTFEDFNDIDNDHRYRSYDISDVTSGHRNENLEDDSDRNNLHTSYRSRSRISGDVSSYRESQDSPSRIRIRNSEESNPYRNYIDEMRRMRQERIFRHENLNSSSTDDRNWTNQRREKRVRILA